ncbi:reverse transcriptase domain-containing protein [Streptomyces sp. NBC_00233]|uniref:reverse transcriptase domain-containing protein n=1 Tax=Streptomyces sp. NBC_00233 TaxID=2975686 RepID=UPI00224F654A|nr:reverse transcriptase domain-containing protein [Streptomyces sp. NBC_00233]MCX5226289.1 reverse transcriptase domain-containing protein [Streptomyces sp. NBC_00233]
MTNSDLQNLNIPKAVRTVLGKPLDRLPALITDRSLANSHKTLTSLAEIALTPNAAISVETITMPKKKFGHRPIVIPDVASRCLYVALVDSIDKQLEPDSRSEGNWTAFEKFAEDSPIEYIVDIDIAACYEFIDHEILHRELLMRTMDHSKADAIRSFLRRCSFNGRGLPQLSTPSDRLADLYLSVLERQLLRRKLPVVRYADDFRIRAENWETANGVIEYAAEYARELGLILSSDKTGIIRAEAHRARAKNRDLLEKKYFDSAKSRLTLFQLVQRDYDDVEVVEILPDDEKALKESMRRIIADWKASIAGRQPDMETGKATELRRMLPLAFTVLQKDDRRIEPDVFTNLIFREPVRLERVCKYVLNRMDSFSETEDNWSLVRRIIEAGRIGPSGRIWLLHVTGKLPRASSADCDWVLEWAAEQCTDRHEMVRAEAAWVSAKFGALTDDMTVDLLKASTTISEHAIAAAIGRQGDLNASLRKSVTSAGPLNREAFSWGEQN